MKITLAGYNLDVSLIEEAMNQAEHPEAFTPETIAVAYARISRDPSPVSELREKAISDIEKARKSACAIVFDMGHQSVAEHAAFNFDVLDISRLCVESLEWHRLCSYTEKSQRYQELEEDFVEPSELEGEDLDLFRNIMGEQFAVYREVYGVLLEHFRGRYPEQLETKRGTNVVEGYAKEDARYVTGLATKAQLGFTASGRNLEYVIRSLRAHPLREVRELGEEFYRQAGAVAPALILLTDPVEYEKEFGRPLQDDHFTRTRPHTREVIEGIVRELPDTPAGTFPSFPTSGDVKLLGTTPEPDLETLQAIIHSHSYVSAEDCARLARQLLDDGEGAARVIREFLRFSNPWEAATREFELAQFTFEVVLSAACFGQMKRHRMTTQLLQGYNPELGYTYPPAVLETGLKDTFERIYDRTSEAFLNLKERHPRAAEYILTNGHRRRMIVGTDARELYHISRLREDAHAQWDIRQVSGDMVGLAREVAPLTLMLAYGKDVFGEKKEELFD